MRADIPFLYVRRKIDIPFIMQQVAISMEMPVEVIIVKSRKREIVTARQMSMRLAKEFTTYSLAKIGAEMGGKDHATVLHACKTIDNLIDTKDATIMETFVPLREKFIKYKKDLFDKIPDTAEIQSREIFNTEK